MVDVFVDLQDGFNDTELDSQFLLLHKLSPGGWQCHKEGLERYWDGVGAHLLAAQGGCLLLLQVNGAQCLDSVFRTQVLEGDITSTAPQGLCCAFPSVAWNAFPSCPQIQTSCHCGPTSGPFSSSLSPLWNQNQLPPALRTASKWKLQNSPTTQTPKMI